MGRFVQGFCLLPKVRQVFQTDGNDITFEGFGVKQPQGGTVDVVDGEVAGQPDPFGGVLLQLASPPLICT